MLSLPSKPWKKIKIDQEAEGLYRITILSPLKDEVEFNEIIHDDLELCLGEHDNLADPRWDTKSMTLTTKNLESFRRKLISVCIMVEKA